MQYHALNPLLDIKGHGSHSLVCCYGLHDLLDECEPVCMPAEFSVFIIEDAELLLSLPFLSGGEETIDVYLLHNDGGIHGCIEDVGLYCDFMSPLRW